ncbi:MAG: DUF3592 domain-containing protein [Lachnospiraceae bacterium]|nr:DUF3592 domain-containing protein [Lachnospiraceae bacterium]
MDSGKKVGGIVLMFFGGLFLFLGLLFAIAFVTVGNVMGTQRENMNQEWESFAEYAEQTTGEIVDTNNGTTVKYYADGAEYWEHFSVSNSAFGLGDDVAVYYDAADPDQCMVPELFDSTYGILNMVFSGLGIGLGAFFGIMGLALLIGGMVLGRKAKAAA